MLKETIVRRCTPSHDGKLFIKVFPPDLQHFQRGSEANLLQFYHHSAPGHQQLLDVPLAISVKNGRGRPFHNEMQF
ncbi:hypothetical protein NUACC26_088750 [Scytonema sp. NUACC26]